MDKRKKLLSAALEMFVESGFHATPTSKISKQAGVATGTLFYLYPSKDDLIKALYVDIQTRLTESIQLEVKGETDAFRLIKGYFVSSLKWALANTLEFKFVMQFTNSPYLNLLAGKDIERNTAVFKQIIIQAIQHQILKPLDAEFIFYLIRGQNFSMYDYLTTQSQLKNDEKELIIDQTFDLLWSMIALG